MSKKIDSKKASTSKVSEKKDTSKTSKKDESKKEESKKSESKKEESKKDESKKTDSKKEESKKDESKKDESKKGDSKKEGKDDKKEEGKSEAPKEDGAKSTSNATPEQIKKNQEMLDKVFKLMETLKPDQVTRSSKDDLSKVQQLIKNITYRDNGDKSRVREVELTDKQKEIIKLVSGSVCDSQVDVMGVTMTEGEEGKSVSGDKINFPFEKLEFVKTKG